jgi:UDP-N-acetylglucosamine 4-epimerase
MSAYDELQMLLKREPRTWLITGAAGFIGSNLLEALLGLDQRVIGLDNFATGHRKSLDEVKERVHPSQWKRFNLIEGDISEETVCRGACAGADIVLHQAALGSVPASMENPIGTHRSNVTGFLNVIVAARDAKAKRLVYASSSSVYGDDPQLPKTEHKIGKPLSPYAATKAIDEVYADAFANAYGFNSIGLRYFNVFGPRQDPEGAYAAVIPRWIAALLKGEPIYINGDGETTRDFCFVQNVVQANLLAATTSEKDSLNRVYNIALGQRTTLNQLFDTIQAALGDRNAVAKVKPIYRDFRPGDVRHSIADISNAQQRLGYVPEYSIDRGLELAMQWYQQNVG